MPDMLVLLRRNSVSDAEKILMGLVDELTIKLNSNGSTTAASLKTKKLISSKQAQDADKKIPESASPAVTTTSMHKVSSIA